MHLVVIKGSRKLKGEVCLNFSASRALANVIGNVEVCPPQTGSLVLRSTNQWRQAVQAMLSNVRKVSIGYSCEKWPHGSLQECFQQLFCVEGTQGNCQRNYKKEEIITVLVTVTVKCVNSC